MSKTRRSLLVFIVLLVACEVAAGEPTAPPSVSCLDAEGERYLQSLRDRIHQLETQLDAETEARLTERAETQRMLQGVTDEVTQRAATALDPPQRATTVEAFDPEKAKKEMAALQAALDEATAARRSAEAEAAAASETAVTFANALKEAERRLDVEEKKNAAASVDREEIKEVAERTVAAPAPTPEPDVQHAAAEPSPTTPPAEPSESERAAAQLAALSGNRTAAHTVPAAPAAPPPTPEPSPKAMGAELPPIATPAAMSESDLAAAQLAALSGRRTATATQGSPPAAEVLATKPAAVVPESERAAAQLAALTGKVAPPTANPAPRAPAPNDAEPANPPATVALAAVEAEKPPARCDEPAEASRIVPGDRLAIHVDHLKEVSDTVEVGSDGLVHLPLVGTVSAAGRNQREFVADLTERLTAYLQSPRVDVALKRDCGR